MTARPAWFAMSIALAVLLSACAPTAATPASTEAPSALSATPSPQPVTAPPSVPPAAISPTVARITLLQAAVAADPSDPAAQRDLGLALLQRIRETADPALYAAAGEAFDTARSLDPNDALILVGIGGLQLGKHEFADALKTGRDAVDRSPGLAAAHAVVVDALVELGRYDEADAAVGELLGLTTDLTSLSRVSYLAELHGKLDVALAAIRLAADSPAAVPENVAFAQALLGNLLVYTGDTTGAAAAYERALDLVPAHAPSLAGLGRLAVGADELDDAMARFKRAADILPLPEYVIALAEAQQAAGRTAEAADSVALARAEITLFQAAGVIVDIDLALFEAEHGDPATALELAEVAYKATPTVRASDAKAWALHRLGRDDEAERYSHEALRLGSRDPLLRYHAGAIAAALGKTEDARRDLGMALATDPGFSATGAAEARRILASLPD